MAQKFGMGFFDSVMATEFTVSLDGHALQNLQF